MSVSQAAQRRTWFTQYRISDVAENLGRLLVRSVHPNIMILIFELILTVKLAQYVVTVDS